jgi:hypothetical protein
VSDQAQHEEKGSRWWRLLAVILAPTVALIGLLSQVGESGPQNAVVSQPQGRNVWAAAPAAGQMAARHPGAVWAQQAPDEARLGAGCEAVDDALVDQLDLPPGQGQGVISLLPGGAAARVGVEVGDVLLELDDRPVPRDRDEFLKLVGTLAPNQPVDVLVLRKAKKQLLKGLFQPAVPVMGLPGVPGAPGPGLPGPAMGNRAAQAKGPIGFVRFGRRDPETGRRDFHASSERNGVTIEVRGSVGIDDPVVRFITIQNGAVPRRYERLDDVPAVYRGRVREVIDRVARD